MQESQQAAQPSVETHEKKPPLFSVETVSFLIAAPAFFVFFLWNFFDNYNNPLSALGVNMTVFYVLILAIVWSMCRQKGVAFKQTLPWTLPLFIVAMGFALFENPFVRVISLFVFFFAMLVFAGNFFIGESEGKNKWTLKYLFVLFFSYFAAIADILKPFQSFFYYITPKFKGKGTGRNFMRAVYGVLIFIVFASLFIVPLLSAADENFKEYFHEVMAFIAEVLSFLDIPKMFFFLFLFTFIGALSAYLLGRKTRLESKASDKPVDGIVSGIVLGGTLFLYLVFLSLQLKYVFTGALPLNFEDVEFFVKSGFWQLFILTVINGLLFVFYYGRSIPSAPLWVLRLFTLSSLLLLFSAAQRVFLYVFYYGLSYEKFYALYTVIFCIGIFIWFLWLIFSMRGVDLLRVVLLASLWMYAVSTVLPMERLIFGTNMILAQNEQSRIQPLDLRMLSVDAAGYVVKNFESIVNTSDNQKEFLCRKACYNGMEHNSVLSWNEWLKEQKEYIDEKRWYEHSVSSFFNRNIQEVGAGDKQRHFESEDLDISFSYPNDLSIITLSKILDISYRTGYSYKSNEPKGMDNILKIQAPASGTGMQIEYFSEVSTFWNIYRKGENSKALTNVGANERILHQTGEYVELGDARGEWVDVYYSNTYNNNVVEERSIFVENQSGVYLISSEHEEGFSSKGDSLEELLRSQEYATVMQSLQIQK